MSGIAFVRAVGCALAASSLVAALGGCASIHSDAVRGLIDIESKKIQEASDKSKDFVTQTDERSNDYQSGLAALDESAKQIHMQEALWSLVFSSNQNVESKSGIDALAVAYRREVSPITAARSIEDQRELALGVLRQQADGRWVWKMDPAYIRQRVEHGPPAR